MKITLALLLMVVGLTACRLELPPIDSAFVAQTWIKPDSPDKTPLSPAQVAALKAWFARHVDGWKYEIADIYPDTFVLLR